MHTCMDAPAASIGVGSKRRMTPEQTARQEIDRLLIAAGWHVCGVSDANIHAARGAARA